MIKQHPPRTARSSSDRSARLLQVRHEQHLHLRVTISFSSPIRPLTSHAQQREPSSHLGAIDTATTRFAWLEYRPSRKPNLRPLPRMRQKFQSRRSHRPTSHDHSTLQPTSKVKHTPAILRFKRLIFRLTVNSKEASSQTPARARNSSSVFASRR